MGKTTKYPPPSKNGFDAATHFLISEDDSNIPLYQSADSTTIPIEEAINDSPFRVLEVNLGDKFHLAKISDSTGNEFYVQSIYAQPFPDTNNDVFVAQIESDYLPSIASDIETHIKDIDLNKPYFENNKYSIALDSGTTLKSEYEENLQDLKNKALESLLQHYGRTMDDLSSFIDNPFNLIDVSAPYFPTRPGQNIRVKISVFKKYFESLETLSFDEFATQNIHINFISTSFPANKIEAEIRKISKILDKYSRDIGSFEGSLGNLDFKKLSMKSLKFFSDFKSFLSDNNISLSNLADSKFELGFDKENFRLSYVLLFDPYGKFLNIGIPSFANKIDIKLAKILISHKGVLSSAISGMGWMDFCKTYLAGEFSINFTKISDIASLGKIPTSAMKLEFDLTKISLDKLSFMTAKQSFGIASLIKSPSFRLKASDLLANSRDLIGDNFLINLPEILLNIEDLSSLYELVFDKVSIKDLTDIMMEKFSEELNLPDFNEIKLRGILKTLRYPDLIAIAYDLFSIPEIGELNKSICEIYKIAPAEIDSFLDKFISVDSAEFYLLHYDADGNLAGLLPDFLEEPGRVLLHDKLKKNNIENCLDLIVAYGTGNFKFKDYVGDASAASIFCQIMSEGFPIYTSLCTDITDLGISLPNFSLSSLKMDIIDVVLSLKKPDIKIALDLHMKNMFKIPPLPDAPSIYQRFLQIPKIKTELDKLSLTKQKLLSKAPGLDIDLEAKKIDVSFTLPSIKKVNPSFDFSKFQFKKIDDIFGGAMASIEGAIIQGIEKGLIGAFKGVLKNVLKSMNLDTPSLRDPDFGGLSMNDLLDASPGASAINVANLALPKMILALDRFDPSFSANDPLSNDTDISGFNPGTEDIKNMFDDMSSALKPMELTRIMKGQSNSADYINMKANIADPSMRTLLNEDLFTDVMGTVTDYVDLNVLEELEEISTQGGSITSFCENNGIPYKMGKVKDMLKDKYSDLDDDEIDDLINNIVEEAKDSVVDAIGNMKEDFSDSLPFDENPCSFMPKPSDIPALNYVNNLTFDAIFDSIELEYKSEATSFPDIMMVPAESDEYVQLYYNEFDQIPDPLGTIPPTPNPSTGLFSLDYVSVGRDEVYNQDFGNHYYGTNTPLYEEANTTTGYKLTTETILKNEEDEWSAPGKKVFVKKQEQNLSPLPELGKYMRNPAFSLKLNTDYASIYTINFKNTGVKIELSPSTLSTTYIIPSTTLAACNDSTAISAESTVFSSYRNKIQDRTFALAIDSLGSDAIVGTLNYLNLKIQDRTAIKNLMRIEYNSQTSVIPADLPDFAHLFMSKTIEEVTKNISNVDLFSADYMQTFLLEDDDVDLLRLQEAKNAAKDEFNEKCSFTDDGLSKLASSSIKKLIYLTLRIHIIDIVARGCFLYDSIIESEPTKALKTLTFETMNSEILSYDNNYHELFIKNYSKEYGAEFANDNTFSKIFDEIYTDISQFFKPSLFKKSKSSVFQLIKDATNVFKGSAGQVPAHCQSILDEGKFPFVIQRILKDEYGNEVLWNDTAASALIVPQAPYIYRLCYIAGGYNSHHNSAKGLSSILEYKALADSMPDGNLGKVMEYIYTSTWEEHKEYVDGYYIEHPNNPIGSVETHSKHIMKTQESVSFLYESVWQEGDDFQNAFDRAKYILIPVAETTRIFQTSEAPDGSETTVTADGTTTTSTWKADAFKDSEGTDEYDLHSFFKDVIPTDLLYTALLMIVHSKALDEKPSISLAFEKTKTTIRRAIESLSQDPEKYDFEENDTKNNQLKESQGIGTQPDFSANAAKMALMTVPMIVKGFAEMFDPNTQIASKVRMGADLAGFNIPPAIASIMCLPMNIIPGAPGPPLTPLGLLYLATSFLEPKERKRLSDIRKGKKLNPGADPDTGSFIGGTETTAFEELARAAADAEATAQAAIEAKEAAIAESLAEINDTIIACVEVCASSLSDFESILSDIMKETNDSHPYMEFPDNNDDEYLSNLITAGYNMENSSISGNQRIMPSSDIYLHMDEFQRYKVGTNATNAIERLKYSVNHFAPSTLPNNLKDTPAQTILKSSFVLSEWLTDIPLKSGSANIERYLTKDKFSLARHYIYRFTKAQYVVEHLLTLCVYNVLDMLSQDIHPAILANINPTLGNDYAAAAHYYGEQIKDDYLKYNTSTADSEAEYQNLKDAARTRVESLMAHPHAFPEGEWASREELHSAVFSIDSIFDLTKMQDILTENYTAADADTTTSSPTRYLDIDDI